MNILVKYNKCIYCNSKKLVKIEKQNHFKNFYVRSIISDLKIKNKDIKKIKVFKCSNCKLIKIILGFLRKFRENIFKYLWSA